MPGGRPGDQEDTQREKKGICRQRLLRRQEAFNPNQGCACCWVTEVPQGKLATGVEIQEGLCPGVLDRQVIPLSHTFKET